MYIAHKDEPGCGSTVLHTDMTDAWNLCTFGKALWHIFWRRHRSGLADWCRANKPTDGYKEGSPIHQQQTYLTKDDLAKLRKDTGIVPFTIEQSSGQMVIIPSGCAHQVRTCRMVAGFLLTLNSRLAILKILSRWRVILFTQAAFRPALNYLKSFAART